MTVPRAIIVAGANGAGKTTFARQFLPLLHPGLPFFNVDEVQRERPAFREPVAVSREFLRRVTDAESSRQSFAIETTLSSRTYVARARRWQTIGYRTVLHFIEVPSADFAVARVASRVAAGGHDIPEPDVRRRFHRGLALFLVYTSVWFRNGTIGILTPRELSLSQATIKAESERKLELLLEAARRANWDAMHGPRHLRTGRFFISRTLESHLPRQAQTVTNAPIADKR